MVPWKQWVNASENCSEKSSWRTGSSKTGGTGQLCFHRNSPPRLGLKKFPTHFSTCLFSHRLRKEEPPPMNLLLMQRRSLKKGRKLRSHQKGTQGESPLQGTPLPTFPSSHISPSLPFPDNKTSSILPQRWREMRGRTSSEKKAENQAPMLKFGGAKEGSWETSQGVGN